MLKINNLTFSYGRIQVLKGVSFEVKQGEILSIAGVDGAGKSTLLKCIAGLLKPQGGQIPYNSEPPPGSVSAVVAKGVTLVPEGRWIFPNLTAEENLLMGGYLVKNRKGGLEEAYNVFDRLKERHAQRVGTMSGEEQQMLAIARRLMPNPKVLVLDESSLGLAPPIVNEAVEYIDKINRQGVTILLAEQNARKALKIAHHAYIMEQGKIVRYGTGDEIARDESVVAVYLGRKK